MNKYILLSFLFLLVIPFINSAEKFGYNYLDNEQQIVASSITINESNFDHNLLLNLQGGQTSEYYHLNLGLYTFLAQLNNGTNSQYKNITYNNAIYKKYSDYTYLSMNGTVLQMPKAGNNYFYTDQDYNWSLVRVSNGTLVANLTYAKILGWLESTLYIYDDGILYCDNSGIPFVTDIICPKNKNTLIITFINNLSLIIPLNISSSSGNSSWNESYANTKYANINLTVTNGANITKDTMMIYEGTNCIFIGDKSLYDGSC